jgi:hypothetical protein
LLFAPLFALLFALLNKYPIFIILYDLIPTCLSMQIDCIVLYKVLYVGVYYLISYSEFVLFPQRRRDCL